MFKLLKEKLLENKLLVSIVIFYFLIRLINLIVPPLFNDEAIYLDWGYREIHRGGFLFYSLYDGKQPFLMWIFGIMETFFSPAFSGRIVSVFAGFLTLLGLYKISENLFNKQIGLLCALFYSVVPIFSFYDRQALMESSVAAIGVWSFYFLLNFLKNRNYRYSIALGLVLGIGFFIKTSSAIFLICSTLILSYLFFYKKEKMDFIQKVFVFILTFFLSIFLLLLNPQFWNTLGSNSRFVLSIKELISFPIIIWFSTLFFNIKILFIYFTPLVFAAAVFGAFLILKIKDIDKRIFSFYFLFSIILETLTVRFASERYLVSFSPLLLIPASYFLFMIVKKYNLLGKISFLVLISLPLTLTILQILNQPAYILFIGRVAGFYHSDYLEGYSSGYGVNEAINYLKTLPNGKRIEVGVAENTGNPESAIIVNFTKDKYIQAGYFDSRLLGIDLSGYDCIRMSIPTYFVSRDEQLAGLDKFLIKLKTIKNPYGKNTIGIYILKTNCSGNILELQPVYNSN